MNSIIQKRSLFIHYYAAICCSILFLIFFFFGTSFAVAVTYTVTNTSGKANISGSLPWAVNKARDAGKIGQQPIIEFKIPGDGPYEIVLDNYLWIEQKTVVDARTQPGYAGIPLIKVNANGNDSAFILEKGVGSTIAGFQIYNFAWNAIATKPEADSTIIRDNYIGFYWDSANNKWWRNFEVDLKNWRNKGKYVIAVGIGIQSSFNKIENNVISGVHNGISIGYDPSKAFGAECIGNEIRDNFIGTTPDGSSILTNTPGILSYRPDPNSDPFGTPDKWAYFGNNSDGIYLTAQAIGTIITDNVSSGNFSVGIELLHETVTQTAIYGNRCGVDVSGMRALPNGELGIIISGGAHDNIVGDYNRPNIFSGNPYAGVELGGAGSFRNSVNNLIKGNLIGCNNDKTASIGNQDVGIHVGTSEAHGNQIEGNIVAGNKWGIYLEDTKDNILIGNFVGICPESLTRLDNKNEGIMLDNSTGNVLVNNTAMYSGFNSGHSTWGQGIREINGSSGNVFSGNDIRNNQNESQITNQSLPGCIYIDRYLGLTMTCTEYAGTQFRYHMDLFSDPNDPTGIYWKLDTNSLQGAASSQCCLQFDSSLGLSLSGVNFGSVVLGFDIDFSPNLNDPTGLYWILDMKSLSIQ